MYHQDDEYFMMMLLRILNCNLSKLKGCISLKKKVHLMQYICDGTLTKMM